MGRGMNLLEGGKGGWGERVGRVGGRVGREGGEGTWGEREGGERGRVGREGGWGGRVG